MAGVPLFTDNHVRYPIVKALRERDWDVVRSTEAFADTTDDETLFAYAAEQGRVFVTNDKRIHVIAMRWLAAGRPFRMVFWRHKHHELMSDGDFVRAFGELAAKPDAFAYPIEYLKPMR